MLFLKVSIVPVRMDQTMSMLVGAIFHGGGDLHLKPGFTSKVLIPIDFLPTFRELTGIGGVKEFISN